VCGAMQRPWSRKLVQGEKKIEIRSYALPAQLRGACAHEVAVESQWRTAKKKRCCCGVDDDGVNHGHRTGKPMEVLETMRSSFGSTLPDVVDPDSDECDKLFLVSEYMSQPRPRATVCPESVRANSEGSVCCELCLPACRMSGKRLPTSAVDHAHVCVCGRWGHRRAK
jgi:hypothetical protein